MIENLWTVNSWTPDPLVLAGDWNAFNITNVVGPWRLTLVSPPGIQGSPDGFWWYISTIHVASDGTGDTTPGLHSFALVADQSYSNQWGGVTINIDDFTVLPFFLGSLLGPTNTISLEDGFYYSFRILAQVYPGSSSRLLGVMKTSAPPVSVTMGGQTPTAPTSNDPVVVSIVTSQPPSAQEQIYLRWSSDTFVTSDMVPADPVEDGVSYSATIPAQPTGTSVEYCITTSTVDLSQVTGSGIIDSLTLSTSPHSHYVVAPGATPTTTPSPTATSTPKGTPPPTPRLSGLTYNGGTPFVDGTNLITGTTYTITAQASSNTQSVVFATNGKTAATVSLAAFSFTFTAPANTAAYILTVTPWSWVQGTGTQGASITVKYNVVAASSPTPTPTPTPTATPVDTPTPTPTPTLTPTPTPTPANHAPVVNAGPDQIVATRSTGLSGSATDDGLPNPPRTLTYVWSKVSGPGSVTFGNAQTAITTATFSVGGIYTLKLSSSDGALTGTDTVVLTVNKSPVVNAGPDQTITLPGAATLSGSATDDGIPNPPGTLSYTWTKSTGPGTVTLADTHAASTTAAFSVAGTYTLQLSASDGVFSSSDKLIVTVNPNPSPDLKVTVTDGKTTIVARHTKHLHDYYNERWAGGSNRCVRNRYIPEHLYWCHLYGDTKWRRYRLCCQRRREHQ